MNPAVSLVFNINKGFKDKKNGLSDLKIGKSTCVTPPGFEPGLAEPKSDVLPLHHEAIRGANIEVHFLFFKNYYKSSEILDTTWSISTNVLCLLNENRIGTRCT